jgi:hypothetical protein
MANPHLAGLAVEVSAENWSGRLTLRAALDGSVINSGVPCYRNLASQHLETLEVEQPDAKTIFLRSRTTQLRYRRQVLAVEVTHEVLRISSRSFTVTLAARHIGRDGRAQG